MPTLFCFEIQPKIAPYEDLLNRKMVANAHVMRLSQDPSYAIYFRSVESALSIFRENNISIEAYLNEKHKNLVQSMQPKQLNMKVKH